MWTKLKAVRMQLTKLTSYYSKAQLKVLEFRTKVDFLQTSLQVDPLNSGLYQEMITMQRDYDKWLKIEEVILKQKSKIHWINCGDGNNRFFHASLKSRGTN